MRSPLILRFIFTESFIYRSFFVAKDREPRVLKKFCTVGKNRGGSNSKGFP